MSEKKALEEQLDKLKREIAHFDAMRDSIYISHLKPRYNEKDQISSQLRDIKTVEESRGYDVGDYFKIDASYQHFGDHYNHGVITGKGDSHFTVIFVKIRKIVKKDVTFKKTGGWEKSTSPEFKEAVQKWFGNKWWGILNE